MCLEGAFLPLYRCHHAWGECVCTSAYLVVFIHTVRIKDPNVDFIFMEFRSFFFFFRGVL